MCKERAWKLLRTAGVFFSDEPDPDEPGLENMLNMNDTFAWALAYGPEVRDDEVQELSRLFVDYGYAGIFYWCTTLGEDRGIISSEFEDVQRKIDFVRNEERIRNQFVGQSSSKLAYHKEKYTLGART